MYLTLPNHAASGWVSFSHIHVHACTHTATHTNIHTHTHPHVSHKPLLTLKNTCTIRIHTQRHCQIMQLVVGYAVHVLHSSDSFVSHTGFQRFSLTQHSLGVDGQCHQCIQLCSQCNAYNTMFLGAFIILHSIICVVY